MTDLAKGLDSFNSKDYKAAYNILKPLADGGDANAQYIIGCMCEMGLGIPQNYRAAFVWYESAFKQGYAMAQFKMGEIHYQGLMGMPENHVLARDCFRNSAVKGIASAQYNLAGMYERGEAVAVCLTDAHKWYNIAASNGYENAATERDRIAENMTPRDIIEAQDLALFWFENNPQPTA